jgi:hypothetical protein
MEDQAMFNSMGTNKMIVSTIRKQFWAVIALIVFTILFGIAPQMKAAEQTLTAKQAKALVATAKTPEDHMKLATYFNSEADRLEAEATGHDELSQAYRRSPGATVGGKYSRWALQSAGHCDAAAKSLREAAKSSRELAAEHEQMAKDATK